MVTTAARRLVRQHNSDSVHSGVIYLVDLSTGEVGEAVATYAATQIAPGDKLYGSYALLRIGHSKLSQKDAQRFIDEKGQGW